MKIYRRMQLSQIHSGKNQRVFVRPVRPTGDPDTLGKTTAGNSIQFLVAGCGIASSSRRTNILRFVGLTRARENFRDVYTRCVIRISRMTPDVHSDMLKLCVDDSRMQFLYNRLRIIFYICYNLMSVTIEYYCRYYNIEMLY